MSYTEAQARAKAQQIFDRFGWMIHLACEKSGVAEEFLAGFIGVEAGIDRQGMIRPEAKRFEPGVFEDLKSLRDKGFCIVGGKTRLNYSGVTQKQLEGLSDAALANLATSWGMSQIMGWHCLNNLNCSIEDLRDPEKHLFYTIRLLKLGESGKYLSRGDLASVLRIWNTGSANGKTYHASYVPNALLVRKHYAQILKENPSKFVLPNIVGSHKPSAAKEEETEQSPEPSPNPITATLEVSQIEPEKPKDIPTPEPVGFKAKITKLFTAITGGTFSLAVLKEWMQIQISPETLQLLKYLLPTILILGVLALIVWYVSEKVTNWKLVQLQAEINSDKSRHDIKVQK